MLGCLFDLVGEKMLQLTLYPQVSAQEGFSQVDILNLDLDIVDLSVGLLRAFELATRSQKGRRRSR